MADPDTELSARKRALRAELRAARAALNSANRRDAAERLAVAGRPLLERAPGASVAGYVSTGTEPGTGPLLSALRDRGVRVLLPVVRDDGLLDWAEHPPEAAWRHGRFGLVEPSGPRLGPESWAQVDAAFVPALAVDAHGRRLGRGGGYIDRALRDRRPAVVVAVVYDHEVLAEVPAGAEDEPVDGVLRPTGLLWCT